MGDLIHIKDENPELEQYEIENQLSLSSSTLKRLQKRYKYAFTIQN